MPELSILILLLYYDRPNMVKTTLQSIKNLSYSNWQLAFLDDGSQTAGKPIVEEILQAELSKVIFKNSFDTPETKISQGGSLIGQLMNESLEESNSDIAIMLCDDDALVKTYFSDLNHWFTKNPSKVFSYCNVTFFNPFVEIPPKLLDQNYIDYENIKIDRHKHFLNKDGRSVRPNHCLDASQVAWRTSCNIKDKLWFPFHQTKSLDSTFYEKFYKKYGYCDFNHSIGQYKAYFPNNLTARKNTYSTLDISTDLRTAMEQ